MKSSRLFGAILAMVLLTDPLAVNATTYQDWWNNTSLSGMGLNVGQQGQKIFVSWYMYDQTQSPSWLLFYGDLVENRTLTAPLRRYFGPEPPVYDESEWYGEIVGSATITFTSPTAGLFSYQYDGNSGSFEIRRFTFKEINLTGIYAGATIYRVSNCGANDGEYYYPDFYFVTHAEDDLLLETLEEGCVYQGKLTQAGTHFQGSGSYSCSEGSAGVWATSDTLSGEFTFQFNYSLQRSDGCRVVGRGGGLRYP